MPRKFWCFPTSGLLCVWALFLTLVLTRRAPLLCHTYVPLPVACVCCDSLCERLVKHSLHLRKHLVLLAGKCNSGNSSLSFFFFFPSPPPAIPRAKVCEEKLRYAAYNCVAIDTDMSPWEE